jgi:hypothetical protein
MEVYGQLYALGSFTVVETGRATHSTEDWVGPRVGPDAVEKR